MTLEMGFVIEVEYILQIKILIFYKQINFPLLFIKLKIYDAYIKSISFSNLKTSYIKKLKIISPFGFKAIINQKKASLESKKASLKRTEVDTSSGYF